MRALHFSTFSYPCHVHWPDEGHMSRRFISKHDLYFRAHCFFFSLPIDFTAPCALDFGAVLRKATLSVRAILSRRIWPRCPEVQGPPALGSKLRGGDGGSGTGCTEEEQINSRRCFKYIAWSRRMAKAPFSYSGTFFSGNTGLATYIPRRSVLNELRNFRDGCTTTPREIAKDLS